MTRMILPAFLSILLVYSGQTAAQEKPRDWKIPTTDIQKSDKERDELIGPVKSVHRETVLLDCVSGGCTEKGCGAYDEEYDRSGRVVGNRNRFIVDDPLSRMLVYPFDQSQPRIEKPTKWEDGRLIYTDVYTFDNKARRAEHACIKADGSTQYRSIVVFDEHGRISETKYYNGDGTLGSWNRRIRDQLGNIVESAFYKEDGTLAERRDGDVSYLQRYVYEYQFDAMSNWIKQTISRPVLASGKSTPVLLSTAYRTISYY